MNLPDPAPHMLPLHLRHHHAIDIHDVWNQYPPKTRKWRVTEAVAAHEDAHNDPHPQWVEHTHNER